LNHAELHDSHSSEHVEFRGDAADALATGLAASLGLGDDASLLAPVGGEGEYGNQESKADDDWLGGTTFEGGDAGESGGGDTTQVDMDGWFGSNDETAAGDATLQPVGGEIDATKEGDVEFGFNFNDWDMNDGDQ